MGFYYVYADNYIIIYYLCRRKWEKNRQVNSFRKSIKQQIDRIEPGRIFTFRDLTFDMDKTPNVAVLLSELSRKGIVVRVEKGAYYRPKNSLLGLGALPVYQDEQFRYLTEKLNGYVTGAYIYNKMGLTEQVATTITIASACPVRRFRFKNLEVECVKAYTPTCQDENQLPYLRLLDALKDMKNIPGATAQDIYDRVKSKYFKQYDLTELKKIVYLSRCYPPRVRRAVADLLGDIGQPELQSEISKTILPTTRFNLDYRTS